MNDPEGVRPVLAISSFISAYLQPALGYDAGTVGRRADGTWDGSWIEAELSPVPAAGSALGELLRNGYLLEALELGRRNPSEVAAVDAPDHLRAAYLAALAGSPVRQPTHPAHAADPATEILTRIASEDHYRRRAFDQYRGVPSLGLVRRGPSVVLDVAERVLPIFAGHLETLRLYGSLAMFLQRPFRLSPDVDIATARRPRQATRAALQRALEAEGIEIVIDRENYLSAMVRGEIDVSIDCEFETIYKQPFDHVDTNAVTALHGVPLLTVSEIAKLKRRLGRPKDHVDLMHLGRSRA